VQEENHTKKKIFTSHRRLITCSRRINSFVTEDILLSLHLLLQKICFLGAGLNMVSNVFFHIGFLAHVFTSFESFRDNLMITVEKYRLPCDV
jgi:hypothetical protein